MVIAAGSAVGAVTWREETEAVSNIYVDSERHLYKMFNLEESISKVWHTSTMVYYAEQMAAERTLHQVVQGDNIHQMGGDFLVNKDCELRYAYRSQTPPDRPSPEQLIEACKKF